MDAFNLVFGALRESRRRVRELENVLLQIEALAVCGPIVKGEEAKDMLGEISLITRRALTSDSVIAEVWRKAKTRRLIKSRQ